MAELADAHDSKSCSARSVGSTPTTGTNILNVMHRPLDPRICNVAIDANAFNRDGSANDALVDRLIEIERAGEIILIVPDGVRREVQHPKAPHHVQEQVLPKIFTIKTGLTDSERLLRRKIEDALRGNAAPGKHAADAYHLAEAAKYGGYFITHDQRILNRSKGIRSLLPLRWPRLSEQIFRIDKWSLCRVRLPSGEAAA